MNRFQQEVEAAVDALLLQQVILYPTDAGWGLGCDVEAPPAVKQLHKLKGQEAGEPSTVLVADLAMLKRYATGVPAAVADMLAANAPPTTYILPAGRAVAPALVAADGTIALRIAQDEFCHKVVRRLGHGLVLASASKAGEPVPAVYAEVGAAIVRGADHVVNWGQDDGPRTQISRVVQLSEDGQLEVVKE